MKNKVIVAVLTCLLAATAHATDTFERACRSPQIVLAHINDITTTQREARDQLKTYISDRVQKQYQYLALNQHSTLEFQLLYNYTNGLLSDVFETILQRKLELNNPLAGQTDSFWALVNGLFDKEGNLLSTPTFYYNSPYPDDAVFQAQLHDYLNKSLAGTVSKFSGDENSTNDFLQKNYGEHEAILSAYAKNNYKVLISSHSQGTLFANEYYRYLRQKNYANNNLKMIYAAPAATGLEGNDGAYMLADQDWVINRFLPIVSGGKRVNPNLDIGSFLGRPPGVNGKTDSFGHGFLEIYFNENLFTEDVRSGLSHLNRFHGEISGHCADR